MVELIESLREHLRREVNDVHGINIDEVDYTLERVLTLVAGGTASHFAWLSMLASDHLVPVASVGCNPPGVATPDAPEWEVIRSGKPLRVHDLATLETEAASALFNGPHRICSLAAYPVFTVFQQSTIGVLVVAHNRPRTYPRMQQRVIHDGVRVIEDVLSLRTESIRDPLTGCYNRRHFDRQMQNEWRRANRDHLPLSCAIIDVDNFKMFNDTAGHAEGDQVLRQIGQALASRTRRAGDLVCRYGGEEFGVILPNTPGESAVALMDELRRAVQDMEIPHPALEGAPVSISAGVATVTSFEEVMRNDAEFYMEKADQALYRAKKGGRNRVVAAWVDDAEGCSASA
ncbi:MAG: diguanylate cyclase [Pseudomonadota bacterium]|nr:diguanylate cyclase [Pseudomonadota bacterium]